MSQDYFAQHFGFFGNKKKGDDISSNVVSVLQAGAFFGALGSAPISGESSSDTYKTLFIHIFLDEPALRA